jgi:pyruvate-ferredoxin/flavodoxin oxidoreductase
MGERIKTIDGNEATAHVAYRLSEVIAIYPITPASPMGEHADAWSSRGVPNIWGTVPTVVEMQSEGGAAGVVHGALQTGTLATTFTASQGLLLMIPNMYKIAGELNPTVFHVASRSLAAQALSIFCDHSDVMAARATGFAMLCSSSVQEAMDFALIAHAATLRSRIPFIHFFDGFRTSHEISKVCMLEDEELRAMVDEELIASHRRRALSPDHPVLRGTAQNPDVYFQARETVNPYYAACPRIIEEEMERFSRLTGRSYRLYEYWGDPEAERVIVIMGSGGEAACETSAFLNKRGEKTGVVKVRLYRPFDAARFLAALPPTVRSIAVLDRCKEPGSEGEPLLLDCTSAVYGAVEAGTASFSRMPKVIGGRYGLSSKEFTPAMVKGIFDHLGEDAPKSRFTVGIDDDVMHTSIPYDPGFSIEPESTYRALFYGLGSDGTVGANKNSIKIIGENTPYYVQGYFVYDSRKAGAETVSHLRFSPEPIRSPYLIREAHFIGCHHPQFIERREGLLDHIKEGGTFLLNTPHPPEKAWSLLPRRLQEQIIEKRVRFYVIDAFAVARECGLGRTINTIMQVCFFHLANVIPRARAIEEIKRSIQETYGMKGREIVEVNLKAVDSALENLFEVRVPEAPTSDAVIPPSVPEHAPEFVREVLGRMIAGRGDELPVSALPPDGTFPTGTTKWEKRNLALEIPVWEPDICIQCGKCAIVCPHAVIRAKAYAPSHLAAAPRTFKHADARDELWRGMKYTIQVAPEDCTGCGICVDVCPAKSKTETRIKAINMHPQAPLRDAERENWDFFLSIPETDRISLNVRSVRQQQVEQPLFEFSSACAGCGETPYIKLLSQLFGDRLIVANSTGCSSIYGGNLPTTPWTKNKEGRGPAWSNSLFENTAEFGLGFRLSIDKQREYARELLGRLAREVGEELASQILSSREEDEAEIYEQRKRVAVLKERLEVIGSPEARRLLSLADMLVRKSVWVIGGDGWAYDIGYGGLDHVLAGGHDINFLVLDTEVYSNTGGQMSKATPRAAVAKFAAGGKPTPKKDLGLMAMTYGDVYVASVAMGARDEHTLRAFIEAESYRGPSLIIAYSHCIAHGINMTTAMRNHKAAVDTGHWLLYRYNPDRAKAGENPLHLDSHKPNLPVRQYLMMENRFKMLLRTKPDEAKRLFDEAQRDVDARWSLYEYLAARKPGEGKEG